MFLYNGSRNINGICLYNGPSNVPYDWWSLLVTGCGQPGQGNGQGPPHSIIGDL